MNNKYMEKEIKEKEIKIKLTKPEFVLLQMGIIALKKDLETHDPDKMSIPSIYIDEIFEKIKALNWDLNP